mgnify:FL=1
MKIAVITLHRIVNYGSVLQAYATQRIFEKLGQKVEIIDYFDERMTMFGMLKRLKNKKKALRNPLICFFAQMVMLPSYLKRFSVFWGFIKRFVHLSQRQYHSIEDLRTNVPVADCYCTGSDQVWNSNWNEKIDEAFFLNFVPNGKPCFAYAASFGKEKLDDWEIPETESLLEKYFAISCREKHGTEILARLNIASEHVLDPTLLLNANDWSKIASNRFVGKKYVFVYNLNRSPKIDAVATELSEAKNIPVYTVSYCYHEIFSRKGKVFVCPKVEDFLSLIANAEAVVTDSFHATAFSINFSRNLFVVYPEFFSARLASIVELVGLTKRVVVNQNVLEMDKQFIDFESVQQKLNVERKRSVHFLEDCLCRINHI